jgi:hypothetical protein
MVESIGPVSKRTVMFCEHTLGSKAQDDLVFVVQSMDFGAYEMQSEATEEFFWHDAAIVEARW